MRKDLVVYKPKEIKPKPKEFDFNDPQYRLDRSWANVDLDKIKRLREFYEGLAEIRRAQFEAAECKSTLLLWAVIIAFIACVIASIF